MHHEQHTFPATSSPSAVMTIREEALHTTQDKFVQSDLLPTASIPAPRKQTTIHHHHHRNHANGLVTSSQFLAECDRLFDMCISNTLRNIETDRCKRAFTSSCVSEPSAIRLSELVTSAVRKRNVPVGAAIPTVEGATYFHSQFVPNMSLRDMARCIGKLLDCDVNTLAVAFTLTKRFYHVAASGSSRSVSIPSPTLHNVHRLFVVAVWVTMKLHWDSCPPVDRFASIVGVTPRELLRLELAFASALSWQLIVTIEDVKLCFFSTTNFPAREEQQCGSLSSSSASGAGLMRSGIGADDGAWAVVTSTQDNASSAAHTPDESTDSTSWNRSAPSRFPCAYPR